MKLIIIPFLFLTTLLFGQQSIMQDELEHYDALNHFISYYQDSVNRQITPSLGLRNTCTLNKTVYGWHPYWQNGSEVNYQWNLLSHLSYFSYEVNSSTGNATTTHGWSTAAVIDSALNNGVKVTLCVTLFSGHATFFASSTAQQTLITNLINLVSSRNANGVNIDFEGLPASQSANFTAFMINLANQMHTSIPGSEVSTVLYAVDWSNVFDVATLSPYLDQFIIMGYDYYWSGSTTSGPLDPLYHFGTTYNYTLSKSITFYLNKGMDKNKLILGLPYYGREYVTTGAGIPSAVLSPPNSTTRTFTTVKNNASGNYTGANDHFDNESYSNYYEFFSGGNWNQCFINSNYTMGKRMDLVSQFGIGGMGIWALGYDDGYIDFWDAITSHFTDCAVVSCSDTIFDLGGPNKDYYDNETMFQTIAPTGATGLSLSFQSFSVEANFDSLFIYDGSTTSATLIGSYTGINSPGTVISSGNSLTLRWKSDGGTTAPGWVAIWQCSIDNTPPTTSISATALWNTANFPISFTDVDDNSVKTSFWLVTDYDGSEWHANDSLGFYNDNFDSAINPDWTDSAGVWSITSGAINQSDETEQNSNLFTRLHQDINAVYLYKWTAQMGGTGTNRRSGIHFFSDNAILPNRGNSYFVYFRVDNNKVQIYKVINDVWTLETNDSVNINPGTWYDYRVTYNPVSGEITAWVDNQKVSSWTDISPLVSGYYISLRSGGTNVFYDDMQVFKSRLSGETVTIGNPDAMIRYQNPNPATASCNIHSVVVDASFNWSTIALEAANIDWTPPSSTIVYDGITTDIDTTFDSTQLSGNWSTSTDTNSGITDYQYAIGSYAGGTNISGWTSNGLSVNQTTTGLTLNPDTIYYYSVVSQNGAGLFSDTTFSNGQKYVFISGVSAITPYTFSVYPNPALDEITITSDFYGLATLQLYTMDGKLVLETSISVGSSKVNISILTKGLYLLKINTSDEAITSVLFKL